MAEQKKKRIKKKKNPEQVKETEWGADSASNYGYKTDQERRDKRGLEDWEMVTSMEQSTVGIPFWFVAIFIVLLIVAVGLTFPFWGSRPGYERPWFDAGIPAGVAWVVTMSFVIYYFVEMVPAKRQRLEKEEKERLAKEQEDNESQKSESSTTEEVKIADASNGLDK